MLATGPSADAAWRLVTSLRDITPRRLSLDDLSVAVTDLDVLWIHSSVEPSPLPRDPIMAWVAAGGRLLLTQRAAARCAALGLEQDGPNDSQTTPWAPGREEIAPHVRGLAAFGPHPLFAGMANGTYVWAPSAGEPDARAVYARGKRPAHGRVVACERCYIRLDADRVIAWEYAVGAGGVLCFGAFVALDAPDPRLAPQLGAVLGNALNGDGIPHATRTIPAASWPAPGTRCRRDDGLLVAEPPPLDGALPGLESPLATATRALADEATVLAGRRVLVVGGEQSGVREIWGHPWRLAQDWRVEIGGETPLIRDAQIAPTVVQRHLVSRQRIVEETVATALEHAIALAEYRAEKIGRARNLRAAPAVSVSWTVDLRRMWPYPAACAGDLRFNLGADGRALVVCHAEAAVTFAVNRGVQWRVEPIGGKAELRCTLSATLDEPLRIAVIAGTDQGDSHVALRRRGVTALVAQRRRHEEQVRDYELRVLSPDPLVNTAVEWAKQRIDGFVVDTPGVGRSLVAGYAASRPGWGDGRPGYAWYFGRDACWTALAALAAGDFSLARLVLRHLGQTQDVTGKVIHELTTSGLAHYDAADSTPLFLLLAGRYAAWTGDLPFLEERWPELERAYAFCLTTDSDGDGLIENAGVGHGWIEVGPLAGAKTTLYLASIWLAALESLAPVAQALGREALAAELAERAARARAAIATRFVVDGGLALGLDADGSPQRHRTALTAVPLLLGAVDASAAAAWLDAIADPEFSAPWGVRLLSTRDPLYNPAGYHTGAVWPLYTGWVSLAEYACHRGGAAGEHVLANARLPFARGVGMFEEVLHGGAEHAAGVCPDQAWSAAMLLAPLVEGMLGARPDAPAERLTLAPHLPAHWSECEWRNVHVGHTTLDVRVAARPDRVELRLRRTGGRRLALVVAPAMPSGRVACDATVDGERLAPRVSESYGCRHGEVRLELSDEHVVEIWHRPG